MSDDARRTQPLSLIFVILVVLLAATVWITPRIGVIKHDPEQLEWVITHLRLPRLQLAMIAGAGLSLAGMTFQALFRNPLATPFTLGVSSGASLAVAIAMGLGLHAWRFGSALQMLVAFGGALTVVAVVYLVARLRSGASVSTLLLAGVSINFICGAGILLVYYFLQEHELSAVIGWLIGSVETIGEGRTRLASAILVAVGLVVLIAVHRDLDLLMMGEQLAATRGVEVLQVRRLAYFSASVMTAAVVAVCGPIAFVGLVVPHTMRAVVGPLHRRLLPACALFGMSLLPICDCVARNLMGWFSPDKAYSELPVGVIMNVIGGVFFLVILIRQKTERPLLT